MKKISFFAVFFIFFCGILPAQSAENVTEMIEAETISLADVAYFASTYLGISSDEDKKEAALLALEEFVQFPRIKDQQASLKYDEFAYFCTQVWNIKGGVMLRLTNSPRYAFRELQTMGFISSNASPAGTINGLQALTIITQVIEYSIENETLSLDAFTSPNEIDFGSSISR